MISEIIKFENIGTPNYLIELSHLANQNIYNADNIKDFFVNKLVDGNTVFDGGVYLLQQINFINISYDETLIVPSKHQHFLKDNRLLISKIVSLFIDKLIIDISFSKIFNHNTVYHDEDLSIVVDNKAFKFKYSKLKQFLIDFKVIEAHPFMEKCFSVHSKYKKIFDKNVIPQIKKKPLSLKEHDRRQALQKQHGEYAEVFVLKAEQHKFRNHILIDAIEQISHIDSSAGYDVSSLKDDDSKTIDKFIEVKSYSDTPYFYWSINEIKVAKQEQNNYFLYLINRDEMHISGYEPLMIQNPYKKVLNNIDWEKTCQSYLFQSSKVRKNGYT